MYGYYSIYMIIVYNCMYNYMCMLGIPRVWTNYYQLDLEKGQNYDLFI